MQRPATVTTMLFPRALVRFVAEVVGVGIPFFLYFLTRGAVAGRATEAFYRGGEIVDLERRLGIFHEVEIQAIFLPDRSMIQILNAVYFWGHFPFILAMAVPLYLWRRPMYQFLRNALLASGALGLIIYVAYPVAPPRLMPHLGFVDTLDRFSRLSYQSESLGAFTNPFAAVPSLHVGWALVIGITFVWMFRHPLLRMFGVTWPLLQGTAVIVTGNHFFFDALAGAVVSLAGFAVAWAIRRHQLRAAQAGQRSGEPWQSQGGEAISDGQIEGAAISSSGGT